jgi:hypothetical protein
MTTWINWTWNEEQIQGSPPQETAIKAVFWDITASDTFCTETRTTSETALWLILQWTEKDWKTYANMETQTGNRKIDYLLDILYPYFNNPNYEWPELGELNIDQQLLYNLVTTRLTQTTELIGVAAVIPKVRAQVQSGIAGRWNTNPWISVSVDIETHGSLKK